MADRVLDDETREKILRSGLFPMSIGAVDEFTPPFYERAGVPEDMRPVFYLKPYTQKQRSEYQQLQNQATMAMRREAMRLSEEQKAEMVAGLKQRADEADEDYEKRKVGVIGYKLAVMYEEKIPSDKIRQIVCSAIGGWRNFIDNNGDTVEYRGGKGGLDASLRPMIHERVIDDLSNRLEVISGLSAVEVLGLIS